MSTQNTDRDGRTALHYVATDLPIEEHAASVKKLVSEGLDPNHQDQMGKSPLHFAAIHSSLPMAEELLRNGAEVGRKDAHGNTPLSDAVFNSRGEHGIIELLLNRGADPDQENHHGVSPRSLANSIANYDVSSPFRDR